MKEIYDWASSQGDRTEQKIRKYLEAEESLKALQLHIREMNTLDEPGRPNLKHVSGSKGKEKHVSALYEVPQIVEVDVEVVTQGSYLTGTGRPRGLLVHSTAGRFAKGRENAIATLRDMASRGLGAMVMDIQGVIYVAKNQGFKLIAWHAGSSKWEGVTGLSRYCLGMEICCAGNVTEGVGVTPWGQNLTNSQLRHFFTTASEQSGARPLPRFYSSAGKISSKLLLVADGR